VGGGGGGRGGGFVRLRGATKQQNDGPYWDVVDVACMGTLIAVPTGRDSRWAPRARPRGGGDAGVARCTGLVVGTGPDLPE